MRENGAAAFIDGSNLGFGKRPRSRSDAVAA
jgi:hypothetical protein